MQRTEIVILGRGERSKEKLRKEKLQKTVYENFPGGPVARMPCS